MAGTKPGGIIRRLRMAAGGGQGAAGRG